MKNPKVIKYNIEKSRLPAVNAVHKGMGLQMIRIRRRGEESKNFSTWHLGPGAE
jgi:hypothetical protein